MKTTEEKLKQLVERRHPEYEDKVSHWDFLNDTYEGGRAWFDFNIFKYLKEGPEEYADRVERAYRFNHSREIVDLVSKYIFRAKIERVKDDASDAVAMFWRNATPGGMDIEHYIRQIADKSSIYGRIWVVVDSSKNEESISLADEKQSSGRIYSYLVSPQNALDMSFDDDGELRWILIREQYRDDEDPLESSGEVSSRYRLWTREEWVLIGVMTDGNKTNYVVEDSGVHNLGVVPVFPVDHITTDESKYTAPSLIGDIAYLDRAVANYLSNLDAIIQDQTFSQLAMPAQGVLPGDDEYDQLMEMGTKRIFLFDGENGAKPFFLSPDPKQAELIISVVKQIINEIYHSVGVAGERTKSDNSMGIDNSSGVAKAYDFERVNSLLTSKAGMLEAAENKMIALINLWSGQSNKHTEEPLIRYPDDFDVRGLSDEFEIASQLALIDAPDDVRRYQMEQVVEKLFPYLAENLKEQIKANLKSWPVQDSLMVGSRSLVNEEDETPAQETEQS